MVAGIGTGKISIGAETKLGTSTAIKSVTQSSDEAGNSRVVKSNGGINPFARPGTSAVKNDDGETAKSGEEKTDTKGKENTEDRSRETGYAAKKIVKQFGKSISPNDKDDKKDSGTPVEGRDPNRFVDNNSQQIEGKVHAGQEGRDFTNPIDPKTTESRFDEVAGKQFASDPESAAARFGLEGAPKAGSEGQQFAPPAQGPGAGGPGGGAGGGSGNVITGSGNVVTGNFNSDINGWGQQVENNGGSGQVESGEGSGAGDPMAAETQREGIFPE